MSLIWKKTKIVQQFKDINTITKVLKKLIGVAYLYVRLNNFCELKHLSNKAKNRSKCDKFSNGE